VPLDDSVKAYLDALAASGAPPVAELTPEEAREANRRTAAQLFGPADEVGSVVDEVLPGPGGRLPVRIYHPLGATPGMPALVYLHGGGWVVGGLHSHDGSCRALCARTPCVVVAVDYRLAPEHRFPAALDDAWAATAWVAEHGASIGVDPSRIAVGGDSAGGTLTAGVTFRARERGLPLAFQLLVYPVTDHRFDTASYEACASGYGLTRAAMQWYWDLYLGPEGDGSAPEASPLRADDLAGLPPALVQTCEFDPLRDEGEAYGSRLAAAGVPATVSRHDGLIHGVFRMPGTVPAAWAMLEEAAAALRAAFASAPGAG
jgi:acetyl esterase